MPLQPQVVLVVAVPLLEKFTVALPMHFACSVSVIGVVTVSVEGNVQALMS
ncbi:hypothetical protein D3C83_282080 [compost metagenome]